MSDNNKKPLEIPVLLAGRFFVVHKQFEPVLAQCCVYKRVETEYTFTGRQTNTVTVSLYKLIGDDMIIYRGLLFRCRKHAEKIGFKLVVSEDVNPPRDVFIPDFDALGKVSWRFKQFDAFCLPAKHDCAQIEAVTAFGKSFIIRKIAKAYNKARILVIVPGIDLANDMWWKLEDELGHGRVGSLGGGKNRGIKRVTVSTPESAHKVDGAYPDIVLYDEVHTAASETRVEMLSAFDRAKMFGFSGTVYGRGDKAELQTEALFGPVRLKLLYEEALAHGMITPVKLVMYKIPFGKPAKGYRDDVSKRRFSIWANQYRNTVLVNAYHEYMQLVPDAQGLFMVDKLEHALYVQTILLELHNVLIPIVAGHTPPERIGKLKRRGAWCDHSKVIHDEDGRRYNRRMFEQGKIQYLIGTTALGTGADFVELGFIVYASSAASRIQQLQTAGRGMRLGGPAKTIVVDTMDNFCEAAKARSMLRLKEAREQGWEVEIRAAPSV